MATAKLRRHVLRSAPTITVADARRRARLLKKGEQLAKERLALARWMSKLKWTFRAMDKLQTKISRLERELARRDAS